MSQITFAVAGSLAPALSAFARAFTARTGHEVQVHRGPAGLLAEAIRNGMPVDVFVSASPNGPALLHREGLLGPARTIARNRLVLVVRPGLDTAIGDPLAFLEDSRWRIGMSTPGADPGGDYAVAFLDRLAAMDPVRWRGLRDRCTSLYGASLLDRDATPRSPALDALHGNRADLLIAYGTTAGQTAGALPGTCILLLPLELAPLTQICACARQGSSAPVRRFLDDLQGTKAGGLLHGHGFLPA